MTSLSCLLLCVMCVLMTSVVLPVPVPWTYWMERSRLVREDRTARLGGKLVLSVDEQTVDKYLLQEKSKVIEESKLNQSLYTPSLSFFYSKAAMENSSIFKLVKAMPKGAILHSHDEAITSLDWVVENITYRDNLYMCLNQQNLWKFQFFDTPPSGSDCVWKLVKTEREAAPSADEFDWMLKKNLSMLSTDPLVTYRDINDVWNRFLGFCDQIKEMIYSPVFRDYFRQYLTEMLDDNVQYLELRSYLYQLTELNDTVHDREHTLNVFKSEADKFVQEHPDFSGVKIIMASQRYLPKKKILEDIKEAMRLHSKYPDFLLGYDLDTMENANFPLVHYINELLYPSSLSPPYKLPYFFHAAETNWMGTETDYNLVDALLLNTTRIGHGYGLAKHPKLVQMAKAKDIAVEVNPISNQLLKLVDDPRNHAMVPLMAENFPVVVSSDVPAFWEAAPLSHDFYVAFMDMCGEDDGLAFLKQLAINSIKYSAMNRSEKRAAMNLWNTKWDAFIKETVQTISSKGDKDIIIG